MPRENFAKCGCGQDLSNSCGCGADLNFAGRKRTKNFNYSQGKTQIQRHKESLIFKTHGEHRNKQK